MLRVNQVTLRTDHGPEQLKHRTAEVLRIPAEDILSLEIRRRSVDARKKPDVFYSYALDVTVRDEAKVLHRFRGQENRVCRVDEAGYVFPKPGSKPLKAPVVIVGMGPAGLFCGYALASHGYPVVLLERGRMVEQRQRDVEAFWESGRLQPDSNVQFGEGGAGAFSDGKLNTLVKDRDGRNREVMETLVKFGAKESILYEAKPHVGTDVLTGVVRNLRNEIVRQGGTVRYESKVTGLDVREGRIVGVVVNGREKLACGQVVLAIGHSARDTFSMLHEAHVPLEAKSFAVGFRVEHPQAMIDRSQYGTEEPGALGAASYKVTARAGNGRGVYSFCMCPGGYVVNASSEEGMLAVNGMSYSKRDGDNANSAVIVSVTPEDFPSDHPLAGVVFQRMLERRAYELGGGKVPVQRYGAFRAAVEQRAAGACRDLAAVEEARGDGSETSAEAGMWETGQETSAEAAKTRVSRSESTEPVEARMDKPESTVEGKAQGDESGSAATGDMEESKSESIAAAMQEGKDCRDTEPDSELRPACKGSYAWADLSGLLPSACSEAFVEGMEAFGRQIRGFDRPDAILSGVESRTSSPVRICRDESLQSEIRGLYPCGEGAGYAGGITSAAMDGLRVAEQIASEYDPGTAEGKDVGFGR